MSIGWRRRPHEARLEFLRIIAGALRLGASGYAGPALRLHPEPLSGLGHSVSIPCAGCGEACCGSQAIDAYWHRLARSKANTPRFQKVRVLVEDSGEGEH
jgi:hypothetical protein